MEKEQKALRKQIVEIMWFMRGSITREDAWAMSISERQDVMELMDERIKLVKETHLPLI